MRIVADGNGYEMFIDNKRICEILTDLPDKGAAALGARNCEVHFDNVVISCDDVPDMNQSVTPKSKLTMTWARLKSHV